jgi:hypothetical protein
LDVGCSAFDVRRSLPFFRFPVSSLILPRYPLDAGCRMLFEVGRWMFDVRRSLHFFSFHVSSLILPRSPFPPLSRVHGPRSMVLPQVSRFLPHPCSPPRSTLDVGRSMFDVSPILVAILIPILGFLPILVAVLITILVHCPPLRSRRPACACTHADRSSAVSSGCALDVRRSLHFFSFHVSSLILPRSPFPPLSRVHGPRSMVLLQVSRFIPHPSPFPIPSSVPSPWSTVHGPPSGFTFHPSSFPVPHFDLGCWTFDVRRSLHFLRFPPSSLIPLSYALLLFYTFFAHFSKRPLACRQNP